MIIKDLRLSRVVVEGGSGILGKWGHQGPASLEGGRRVVVGFSASDFLDLDGSLFNSVRDLLLWRFRSGTHCSREVARIFAIGPIWAMGRIFFCLSEGRLREESAKKKGPKLRRQHTGGF